MAGHLKCPPPHRRKKNTHVWSWAVVSREGPGAKMGTMASSDEPPPPHTPVMATKSRGNYLSSILLPLVKVAEETGRCVPDRQIKFNFRSPALQHTWGGGVQGLRWLGGHTPCSEGREYQQNKTSICAPFGGLVVLGGRGLDDGGGPGAGHGVAVGGGGQHRVALAGGGGARCPGPGRQPQRGLRLGRPRLEQVVPCPEPRAEAPSGRLSGAMPPPSAVLDPKPALS
jgi:hypothetical protein